ncbi:MAG: hypothetical protein DYG92_08410, partial [Leptolyngbya sp. PLA1]|nr:hypothetical protein [Leptolyngbya sp. PLA1]
MRPLPSQRGVFLDGSGRAGPFFSWSLAGNPFERGAPVAARVGPIELATGGVTVADLDWAGVGPGSSAWPIGRTYNQLQSSVNDGVQGRGWFQASQPEIVLYDADTNPATKGDSDVLYIVYGADRYVELDRTAANADTFKAKNGAAGVAEYVSGSPDTYVYYDQHGTAAHFFGGNTSSGRADWQLWKVVDAAGNVSYAGHASTASTAASSGYNSDKTLAVAYDAAGSGGRRYTYSYSTVGGVSRLTQVKVETKSGGSWGSPSGVVEVARVTYDYYTTTENDKGKAGYLRTVAVRTSLTDSGSTLDTGIYEERKRYYRYYTRTWDDSDGRRGNEGDLKLVVDPEGLRNYDWSDGTLYDQDQDGVVDTNEESYLSASDSALVSYSAAYLEYPNADHRPVKGFFNGECGCSGGINGTYEFTYGTNAHFSGVSGYDDEWSSRVVVKRPHGTYLTQYFDEVGQPLSSIVTSGDPAVSVSTRWVTRVVRDSTTGVVTEVHTPAANTAYSHADAGSPPYAGDLSSSASVGQITVFDRESSGDMTGFAKGVSLKEGTGGTAEYVGYSDYESLNFVVDTGVEVIRPFVSVRREYHTAGSSAGTSANYNETTISSAGSPWDGSSSAVLHLAPKKIKITRPYVSGANNGRGSGTPADDSIFIERYLREDGTLAFSKKPVFADDSSTQIVSYQKVEGGLTTKSVQDAATNTAAYFDKDPYTDFGLAETSDGKQVVASDTMTYDAQGRLVTSTVPNIGGTRTLINYYSRLKDGRLVSIAFPRYTTGGSTTYYGPASYTVTNHAGRAEFSATIAISSSGSTTALTGWIDETDADPITALDVGTLFGASTSIYSSSGSQLNESRQYHTIPGSGVGSAGTNYDAAKFGYDSMGRRKRTKSADGSITLMTFDALGRTTQREIGTNDPDEASTDNMVIAEMMEYDGGSSGGNSHLTTRTVDPDGDWDNTGTGGHPADDRRITTFAYDYRGRLLLTTNPAAPHTLTKYDNMNRVVAVGQYTSAPSASADPTATTSTNRCALAETFYDELGHAWKTRRHLIDQSDGSKDASLDSVSWCDAEGHVIKSKGESGITKTVYDRLDRVTNRFVIASDGGETAYSAMDDVSGDLVAEEHQTYFDTQTGLPLMQATISRYHDDTSTTGALDTDTDLSLLDWSTSKIKGRVSISITFYDSLNRPVESVALGTYGASNFDRDSTLSYPVTRSDTALVSTTVYNDTGTVQKVTDPKAIETRWTYDDAGRKTAEIRNYVNGTPSSATGDDDLHTRFVYSNGHMTKMWVDLDGDNNVDSDDQVTTYIYGTTAGAVSSGYSAQASGHLLRAVKYPDTSNTGAVYTDIDSDSSDVVSYSYDTTGAVVRQKDQLTGVIETTYDALGRPAHRRVTTLGTGLDGAVRRITSAYLARGPVDTVTQYDNATVGSGSATDQVKFTYDGWGNMTAFDQDVDGLIGAGGRAAFGVQYAWDVLTPSGGASVLARTMMTMPDG